MPKDLIAHPSISKLLVMIAENAIQEFARVTSYTRRAAHYICYAKRADEWRVTFPIFAVTLRDKTLSGVLTKAIRWIADHSQNRTIVEKP